LRLPDHPDGHRRRSVVAEDRAVVLRAELDAGNVLEFDELGALVGTTSSPNSCGVLSSPSERTENSRRVDSMRPAGISTLREAIAPSTSWTVRPRADSASGFTHTRIA